MAAHVSNHNKNYNENVFNQNIVSTRVFQILVMYLQPSDCNTNSHVGEFTIFQFEINKIGWDLIIPLPRLFTSFKWLLMAWNCLRSVFWCFVALNYTRPLTPKHENLITTLTYLPFSLFCNFLKGRVKEQIRFGK